MSKVLNISIVVLLLTTPAWADWFPNNADEPGKSTNHKMHWPQLPDPIGYDVNFTFPKVLADDWRCTESGPVDDIHFWMSTADDVDPRQYMGDIHASIHLDVPISDTNPGFSYPGDRLWHRDFNPTEYTVTFWGQGDQPFYDPNDPTREYPLHLNIWQVNITGIADDSANFFTQKRDTIYWLDLAVFDNGTILPPNGTDPIDPPRLGWKTTFPTLPGQVDEPGGAWNDDAVWGHLDENHDLIAPVASGNGWSELWDPNHEVSLDMAFVITPEPATLLVLALGLIPALLRKSKKA